MKRQISFGLREATGITLLALGIHGMGCAVEGTEPAADPDGIELGAAMQGTGGDPGLPNHLRPACLFDRGVQQTVRDLGAAPLSSELPGALPSMPHMPDADASGAASCRHDFLEILVSCALPQATVVEDLEDMIPGPSGAAPKTYSGEAGLAPDWQTRALSTDEKEILTACVMARTNRFGKSVMVMLDGDADALRDEPKRFGYFYAESTVWGNMFDSKTPIEPTRDPKELTAAHAFQAHVCRNNGAGFSPDAALRVCDEGGCGFIDHGDCTDAAFDCADASGSRAGYCGAWQNKLGVYLRSSIPVLNDLPRSAPSLPLPTPFTPKTAGE